MIKGVNRQVVEVAEPESAYFEKVIFFVKPEFSAMSENKLKDKADRLIKQQTAPPASRKKSRDRAGIKKAAELILSAAAGAAAAGIITAIII